MMKISKGQIAFILVVVVVALIAAFAGSKIAGLYGGRQKYVGVYLETGELYFGRIRWFPSPRMTEVVMFQRAADQALTIDRFSNVVWMPVEPLRISRDKIVFWTYIDSASPVVRLIEARPSSQAPQETPSQ